MLRPGALRVKKGGAEQEMAVAGGFLQVNDDRVLILADQAERADEIDAAAAEEARRRAEQALSEATAQRRQRPGRGRPHRAGRVAGPDPGRTAPARAACRCD